MTEQSLPAPVSPAVSPYLSLRQAVRPLIFARALLASQQSLGGQLADECERLSRLTRDALEAAALVHLFPSTGDEDADGDSHSRRAQLVAAYTRAGEAWAEVIGTALALGDALLASGKADEVRRLADFLSAAGEPAAGKNLHRRADAVTRQALEARLTQIHATMSETEIAAAVEALRESGDQPTVAFHIRSVAESMAGHFPAEESIQDFGQAGYDLYKWLIKPDQVIRAGSKINLFTGNRKMGGYMAWPNYFTSAVKINRLLVPDGSSITGKVALASIVQLPDQIARELTTNTVMPSDALTRLNAIAWEFQQKMEALRIKNNSA